jgi:hypothetical protein
MLVSCKLDIAHQKFDKKEWGEKEDWDYIYRDGMIDDLLAHHRLKGLSYHQLIDLLGQPENLTNNDGKYYQLLVDFGSDIDPVHTKYLVFQLNRDSIVTSYKIKEWKKN